MYPKSHKTNLFETLSLAIINKTDEYDEAQAFVRVASHWLGFEDLEEEKHFIDGAGDLGLDFWYGSEVGFELYQVKSHELINGKLNPSLFNSDGVKDLQTIVAFLTSDNINISKNKKLKYFRHQWDDFVSRRLLGDTDDPIRVLLGLIIFGNNLTPQASGEFRNLESLLGQSITYRDLPIDFRITLFKIDDIIGTRWRLDNREWKDKSGKKRNFISLRPEKTSKENNWISGNKEAVFYCNAYDLIIAFEDFGYQIFEPNVRAQIKKSKVNDAIRDSLSHYQSRKEFRLLNNGITIACKGFSSPTSNRPNFTISEPGIINGLQTVTALHDSYYKELITTEKKHLEENCAVLVRLITDNAVNNINDVVLASNTQNPMQPRNLKSNTNEQILYEKLFAENGWFYARKQGAWDAYSDDPRRWRTIDYKKSHFNIQGTRKYKVVDNESIAQTWLAFIGFSDEAVHNKRMIFENEDYYDMIFLHRISQHGHAISFNLNVVEDYLMDDLPQPALFLVSLFTNRFAKVVSLSTMETRLKAYERLNINPDEKTREEIDVILSRDDEYLLDIVLGGMSYVFTEYFGYILFKALGEQIHMFGKKLLENGTLNHIYMTNDYETIKQNTRNEIIDDNDLLVIAWHAFRNNIDQLLGTAWKLSFQQARSRTRFNHHKNTRDRIIQTLNELDKFMKRRQLTQFWAANIPEKTGIFDYFKKIIKEEG